MGDTCGNSCRPFTAFSRESIRLHTGVENTDYQLLIVGGWGEEEKGKQNGEQKGKMEEGEKRDNSNKHDHSYLNRAV